MSKKKGATMRDHTIFSPVGVSSVLHIIVDTYQVLLKHSSSNWRRHSAGSTKLICRFLQPDCKTTSALTVLRICIRLVFMFIRNKYSY